MVLKFDFIIIKVILALPTIFAQVYSLHLLKLNEVSFGKECLLNEQRMVRNQIVKYYVIMALLTHLINRYLSIVTPLIETPQAHLNFHITAFLTRCVKVEISQQEFSARRTARTVLYL